VVTSAVIGLSGRAPPAQSLEWRVDGRELRASKGRFAKGNVPWNKRLNSTQKRITFTCKFCGRPKPFEEMKVLERFFPALPVCSDCWNCSVNKKNKVKGGHHVNSLLYEMPYQEGNERCQGHYHEEWEASNTGYVSRMRDEDV